MRDTKLVPIKKMKVGDTFRHLKTPTSMIMASFEIVEISGAYCKIKHYDKIDTYSTEGLYAEVPLSEAELKAKYKDAAAALIEKLKIEITDMHEIGLHEMWNAWISTDIYDFAANCEKNDIEVLGWFDLGDNAREFMLDMVLDIGIVAKYKDDNYRFWCHARKDWIEIMLEEWEEEHESKN